MKTTRSHIGGSDHLMSWLRNGKVRVERERTRARAETPPPSAQWEAVRHDDRERLRGIPCLTEGGIGGAINGSRPDAVRWPS